MLNNEELRAVIAKDNLSAGEMIEVITKYIYDRKGVEVKINTPNDPPMVFLMNIAYSSVVEYYNNNKDGG